jgi:hypothetical protein
MAEKPQRTRPPNRLDTETIPVSITPGVLALLEKLTDTHFFGRTVNDTAALILGAEVKRIVMSGELDSLIAKAPVPITSTADSSSEER